MKTDVFIGLDFETTGLDPQNDGIIEIGAVKFTETGEILDEFQKLANPGKKIPRAARRVHGIKDRDLIGQLSPGEVWELLIEWAGDYTAFVAHNAAFEVNFLRNLYKAQPKIPNYMFIDTLDLSRRSLKGRNSYKLYDLVPHLAGRHRALDDAIACSALFLKISLTYKSGNIPKKTSIQPMSSFRTIDNSPTKKQKDYIRDLGGNTNRPQTKQEASKYIDKLVSKRDKKGGSFKRSVLILIVLGVLIWVFLL